MQCVKRVVGLPGERIEIREGDIYVDGQIQRKDLAWQRAMAVPVHFENQRPSLAPALPPRWRGKAWGAAGDRFAHPATSSKDPIDWLIYHHQRRDLSRPGEVREGPVTDDSSYNQHPRRGDDRHAMSDLLLSCQIVEIFGRGGRLILRASDGRAEFRVNIDPQRKWYEVLYSHPPQPLQSDAAFRGRPVPGASGPLPPWTSSLPVELSLVDQQFILAFNRTVAVSWPYDPPKDSSGPPTQPFAVGSQGLGVVVRDLRVYRDVYYTRPPSVRNPWGIGQPVTLGGEEYFVLGDNSPASEDSRTWDLQPAVHADLLIGKPLLVHLPSRCVRVAGRQFQVPDLGGIRYIR